MGVEAGSQRWGPGQTPVDAISGFSHPEARDSTHPSTPDANSQEQDAADAQRPQFEEEYEPYQTPVRSGRNQSSSPRRKSITFTRDTTGPKTRTPVHSRHPSVEAGLPDVPGHDGSRVKLRSKMRAIGLPLKPPPHARSQSGTAFGDPTSSGEGTASEYEDDADVESSAADTPVAPQRRPRPKQARTFSQTTPNTPLDAAFRVESFSVSGSPLAGLPPRLRRRASTTDLPENQHGGYSEDEGRTRSSKHQVWKRRGSAWLHATHQHGSFGQRRRTRRDTSENIRPSHIRRLTQLAGSTSAADGSPAASRSRRKPKEQWLESSYKIRDRIAQFARLGRKKGAEKSRIDLQKSAQLISGMLAGSPAAMILASNFQRDEHNRKKVPVLLEQLKIEVPESITRDDSDRHQTFCVRLEYGSGKMRMRWEVWRSVSDFYTLSLNLKVLNKTDWIRRHGQSQARIKRPRFPKAAFPVLRNWRGFSEDVEEDEEGSAPEGAAAEQDAVPAIGAYHTPEQANSPRRGSRFSNMNTLDATRNTSSAGTGTDGLMHFTAAAKNQRDAFKELQRKKLETWIREVARYVVFSPGSNRLCKFLEISTLGIKLAAEAGYHGKEGLLELTSHMRREFKGKSRKKWFLVRQSYIAFVETPESLSLLDVFLVDPEFRIEHQRPRFRDQQNPKDIAKAAGSSVAHPKHHVIRLFNRERNWVLFATNERQQDQFVQSIRRMKEMTLWSQPHRFDSFAPQRKRVFAEWLVDGRDYMWKVSRAIDNAQHVVYIHDWWLSPEIFTRRPPAISSRWRLDRLLQRKAEQGVKIFVIMYKNIESAIPIDSTHSKNVLLDLHPNVYVMRSPSNLKQNTFFWAHHEKICVVDHLIGFCGGVDLCFGRWDTPEHRVVDDKPTGFEDGPFPRDTEHAQCWPGKDYSNARVLDFYDLNDPFEEMYDRRKVPRMPWHDIGMQIVGQPARDLSRHFVQRWNYLLRNRKASRPIPCLLPPPDFVPEDLQRLDLSGSCEVQILRSACNWSLGTPDRTEHSIMNAYVKLIETSEHFVYIENQFFISSCQVDNTKIHNLVGDALVERIIRAHRNGEDWAAVILIPLMPGFANPVNEPGGASVRLIMQCQFRSICRGETSIFGRLKAAGITPEDYIRFYSLRAWGKIGPTKSLTTEQLYIHAKCMIADDRHVIIGSANINERSQLGTRDSEVAAVVYDTDMIDSVMAATPYKVGRFAHTLRTRLMREHLGIDVDAIRSAECKQHSAHNPSTMMEKSELDGLSVLSRGQLAAEAGSSEATEHLSAGGSLSPEIPIQDGSFDAKENVAPSGYRGSVRPIVGANGRFPADSDESNDSKKECLPHGRDSVILGGAREVLVTEVLDESTTSDSSPTRQNSENDDVSQPSGEEASSQPSSDTLPPPMLPRFNTRDAGLTLRSQLPPLPTTDDTDIGGPPLKQTFSRASADALNPILGTMRRPVLEPDCMRDPLDDAFFEETWHAVADNNTKIFRHVFRCNPDDEVKDWDDYEAFIAYRRKFDESMGIATTQQDEEASKARPPETDTAESDQPFNEKEGTSKIWGASQNLSKANFDGTTNDRTPVNEKIPQETEGPEKRDNPDELFTIDEKKETSAESPETNERVESKISSAESKSASTRRRRRATTKSSVPWRASDPVLSKADAEELLNLVQGHLVVFPYRWLETVEDKSAWLYPFDQVSPLEIYD